MRFKSRESSHQISISEEPSLINEGKEEGSPLPEKDDAGPWEMRDGARREAHGMV